MDHRRIEEENLAELYATGRLPPADAEEFEIHLLECRECRERVAQADDLRDSVRLVAAEAVENAARTVAHLGFFAALARHSLQHRAARFGLLALLLLALAALPAWLLVDRVRLERELAAAHHAPQPVPVPALSPASSPASTGRELERLAQEKSRLEEELRRERITREGLADRIARLTRPQINAAVYSLGLVRGESALNEIRLGSSPEWIVLSLELPPAGDDTYRAILLDAHGATVWQSDGLRPTASDTLTVLLYSDILRPGDYRLRLEGRGKAGGPAAPAGEIPFRVRRGDPHPLAPSPTRTPPARERGNPPGYHPLS